MCYYCIIRNADKINVVSTRKDEGTVIAVTHETGTRAGEVDEIRGFVGGSHDRRYWGQACIVALFSIAGCVVVISPDRSLPDRLATHILAFEGDSKLTFFDGTFSEYEAWRRQTLGDAATRPHRITYRKLNREECLDLKKNLPSPPDLS